MNFERRADGFLHRLLDVGSVRLHVAEARPDGTSDSGPVPDDVPLVVFLHGFPASWWSWRHQLAALGRAGVWAVAPDMRGYGESDKPAGVSAYEVEKLAADVAGLIRRLGREKAIIVGHDWGGGIAWSFAQEHPEMLARLAILNAPHPVVLMKSLRRPAQLRKSWYMFFFQLPIIAERTIGKRDFAVVRRSLRADGVPAEDIDRYIDAIRVRGGIRSAINYYRAAFRSVATGRVREIRTVDKPVLVIWGDEDRYLGAELAEPPKRFVPNARVVHLPEASHWVQSDAPETVNQLLLEFVER